MNRLSTGFKSLSRRERVLLALGGCAALLIVLYALVWEPWQTELQRLRSQVPVKRETLAWMQQQSQAIGPLIDRSRQKSESNERPLLTLVEQSARDSKMSPYIRRMTPGEEEQVKIWLTDADFDKWVVWLEALRGQGIEVGSATINRGRDNRVAIRMTLQR